MDNNCDILSTAYIYIIYSSKYDVKDISTRQFYIGSTDKFNETKIKFYQDLYGHNTSKKMQIMRYYMTIKGISIKTDKDLHESDKFWQIRTLFIGHYCCTRKLLKALEGLYINYYYSIINEEDEEITFNPKNIDPEHLKFFEELNIRKKLTYQFEYKDLIYDVNPYTLISKGNNLKQFLHIYEEICERRSIPKFETIQELTTQIIIEENDYKEPDEIYEETPEGHYKCIFCKDCGKEKIYKFFNTSFHNHLLKYHYEKFRGDFEKFKSYKKT